VEGEGGDKNKSYVDTIYTVLGLTEYGQWTNSKHVPGLIIEWVSVLFN
jgi:hypothetical protein